LIALLNALEHLSNPEPALRAIARGNGARRIRGRQRTEVLAIGRWGRAQVGPLGRTATRMLSVELLDSVLRGAGLHTIASNDVRAAVSSQHFPAPILFSLAGASCAHT
jgi:hypothetical protein